MSRTQKLSAGSSDGLPRKSPLLPKEATSNMEFHGKIMVKLKLRRSNSFLTHVE